MLYCRVIKYTHIKLFTGTAAAATASASANSIIKDNRVSM